MINRRLLAQLSGDVQELTLSEFIRDVRGASGILVGTQYDSLPVFKEFTIRCNLARLFRGNQMDIYIYTVCKGYSLRTSSISLYISTAIRDFRDTQKLHMTRFEVVYDIEF